MRKQCGLLAGAAMLGAVAFAPAILAQQPYPHDPMGQPTNPSQPPRSTQPPMGRPDQPAPYPGENGQMAHRLTADSTFATKAAQGGMAEVKLGQLASERATSAEVKSFGQKMVEDHGKANDELKQIAAKKGIDLPTTLDNKDQSTFDKLSKLSGEEFDRAYMADMVKDHKTDIDEFKKEASRGSDPDMKAFAAKTLPTLENHLQMAESTEASVKK